MYLNVRCRVQWCPRSGVCEGRRGRGLRCAVRARTGGATRPVGAPRCALAVLHLCERSGASSSGASSVPIDHPVHTICPDLRLPAQPSRCRSARRPAASHGLGLSAGGGPWRAAGGGRMVRSTKTSRRAALVGVLSAAALAFSAVPASAGGVQVTPYTTSNDWTYSDCGYPVSAHEEITGVQKVREGKKNKESFYFVTDTFSYRQVHTRVDTGQTFVVRGNAKVKDVQATRVEGNVFTSTLVVKDNPRVVESSTGTVVLRDRGTIR